MNPYEMTGPRFLELFTLASCFSTGAALFYRIVQQRSTRGGDSEVKPLDAYETAYLTGGEETVLHAALASLLQTQALVVEAAAISGKYAFAVSENAKVDKHPIVQQVLQGLDNKSKADFRTAVTQIKSQRLKSIGDLQRSLERRNLIFTSHSAVSIALTSAAIAALPALLAIPKVFIGMSLGKPVGFLALEMFVMFFVCILFCAVQPRRTLNGTQSLMRAQSSRSSLRSTAVTNSSMLSGSEAALAVALFGTAVFGLGPLYDLRRALKPVNDGSGWGGSCGGGSCGGGGGCGGGGCGGCGGCGS